jgi:hypothetical protein
LTLLSAGRNCAGIERAGIMAAGNRPLLRVVLAAMLAGAAVPAIAQFYPFDDRYPSFDPRPRAPRYLDPSEERTDFSRAPAPKKTDVQPTTKVLILGDSLSDWLAYGLEDGLSESPEIGIIRKHRTYSGLIRYEKPDGPDWPQVARELVAQEKPQAVVIMLGVYDRQAIRERAQPQQKPEARTEQARTDQAKTDQAKPAQPEGREAERSVAAPEPQATRSGGTYEYRSEKWAELYAKKVDEMIAAAKSGGVPVLWVGLPSIRGTKSTSDAIYLNDIYRARAERAGIVYVDVWEAFVDEGGKFSYSGPDFEGQIRRLRTSDGVHFTRAGARKLAHYVDRELSRVIAGPAVPVALPAPDTPLPPGSTPPVAAAPVPSRPLAGPVILLSTLQQETGELLGGTVKQSVDGPAARVLVKGEAPATQPGRADDFVWPPRAPNAVAKEPLPPSGTPIALGAPAPEQPAQQRAGQADPARRTRQTQSAQSAPSAPRPPAPREPFYRGGFGPYGYQQPYYQRPPGGFGFFR